MALFHGVINSKALMKDTTLSMIVPSDDRKNIGFQGQPQLLILLHSKLVSMWKDSIFGSDTGNLIEASIRTKLQAFCPRYDSAHHRSHE